MTPAANLLSERLLMAADECSAEELVSVLTGHFVGLVYELVRRKGMDPRKEIVISGGPHRDITIHAEKKGGAA